MKAAKRYVGPCVWWCGVGGPFPFPSHAPATHPFPLRHTQGAEPEVFESTAIFTPVVQLDEVETKTHEEDEETLYKM